MSVPEDANRENREVVEALRESFVPLTKRLAPEVEPALTFTLLQSEAEGE